MSSTVSGINRIKKALPATCASLVILSSLLLSVSLVSAQNSGFAINANSGNLCVNPGINAQTDISISSIGSFSGTVNLSGSVSPSYSNAPTISGVPASVTVASGQSAGFTLGIYTTASTPLYTYTITVSGFSGSAYNSANIELTVSSGCSVGGVIVPMAHGTTGSDLMIGIAIAALIGAVAASLVVYVSRNKSRAKP
jgi:uncharacterized membrane protein